MERNEVGFGAYRVIRDVERMPSQIGRSGLKQARGSFASEGRVSAIGDARRFQGYE